jgi:hypothetical protein
VFFRAINANKKACDQFFKKNAENFKILARAGSGWRQEAVTSWSATHFFYAPKNRQGNFFESSVRDLFLLSIARPDLR